VSFSPESSHGNDVNISGPPTLYEDLSVIKDSSDKEDTTCTTIDDGDNACKTITDIATVDAQKKGQTASGSVRASSSTAATVFRPLEDVTALVADKKLAAVDKNTKSAAKPSSDEKTATVAVSVAPCKDKDCCGDGSVLAVASASTVALASGVSFGTASAASWSATAPTGSSSPRIPSNVRSSKQSPSLNSWCGNCTVLGKQWKKEGNKARKGKIASPVIVEKTPTVIDGLLFPDARGCLNQPAQLVGGIRCTQCALNKWGVYDDPVNCPKTTYGTPRYHWDPTDPTERSKIRPFPVRELNGNFRVTVPFNLLSYGVLPEEKMERCRQQFERR
ncbi:MAG: hypothetical protein SGARI_000685, partial [Bacillariaceae sp.]